MAERKNMLDASKRKIVAVGKVRYLPYERDGVKVPGMSWAPLSVDAELGRRGRLLLRMEPGCEGPVHRHGDYDEFFMIEGSLVDSDGTKVTAGDYVVFEPGTIHYTDSPEGCVILVTYMANNELLVSESLEEVSST